MAKVQCLICNESFKDEDGLAQHTAAKHTIVPLSIPKKPQRNYFMYIVTALIVLGILYFLFSGVFAKGAYDSFAQCLSNSGVEMYGAYWCPHCAEQKLLFGKSAKYLPYVECSLPNQAGQTQECTNLGIQSYPTWEFAHGKRIEGNLQLQQLSDLSNCSLA